MKALFKAQKRLAKRRESWDKALKALRDAHHDNQALSYTHRPGSMTK